jgi:hypothetical protein
VAAAFTAAVSVVWSAELTALSATSLVGYISRPPTTGFVELANEVAAGETMPSARTAIFFFLISPLD